MNKEEYLVCPICGKSDIKMLTTHVSMAHKIKKKEFLEMYPGIKLNTDDMIAQRVNTMCKLWETEGFSDKVHEALCKEARSVEGRKKRSDRMAKLSKEFWSDEDYCNKHRELGYQFYLKTRDKQKRIIEYHGLYLRSSYEVDFVKFCEKNNIRFLYESRVYNYVLDGKVSRYFPDFFLPDYNLIVEIKPEFRTHLPINIAKFNAVVDSGDNIVYVTENELYSKNPNFLLDFLNNHRGA